MISGCHESLLVVLLLLLLLVCCCIRSNYFTFLIVILLIVDQIVFSSMSATCCLTLDRGSPVGHVRFMILIKETISISFLKIKCWDTTSRTFSVFYYYYIMHFINWINTNIFRCCVLFCVSDYFIIIFLNSLCLIRVLKFTPIYVHSIMTKRNTKPSTKTKVSSFTGGFTYLTFASPV